MVTAVPGVVSKATPVKVLLLIEMVHLRCPLLVIHFVVWYSVSRKPAYLTSTCGE